MAVSISDSMVPAQLQNSLLGIVCLMQEVVWKGQSLDRGYLLDKGHYFIKKGHPHIKTYLRGLLQCTG